MAKLYVSLSAEWSPITAHEATRWLSGSLVSEMRVISLALRHTHTHTLTHVYANSYRFPANSAIGRESIAAATHRET